MIRTDGYAPIKDYALIGDGRTCALVARDGSIDWLPLPRMDSETVFARILDAERGGCFELAPEDEFDVTRRYVGDSNVLETTFATAHGKVRVTDAITLDHGALLPWFELVRRVEGVEGRVPMRWRITPRFGAGESEQDLVVERVRDGVVARSGSRFLVVQSFDAGELDHTTDHVGAAFETYPGSDGIVSLRSAHDEPIPFARRDWLEARLADTAEGWSSWLADAGVDGPWRAATRRCALTLRALTFVPTGAIVAAPTTSLPERIGGDRNYDYRYSWVRDTAFTLDALINLELLVQVHASFSWLLEAVADTAPDVHVFYDLDANTTSKSSELELAGYRGSRPVRRGNQAARQLQLGCYGDLLETAELYVREGSAFDDATADLLVRVLDRLAKIWRKKDSGIWELPEKEHYTSSKISAWMAFDRALQLVRDDQLPAEHADAWRATAQEMRAFVEVHCWSEERGCYVMAAGSEKLDASVLRAARTSYVDPRGDRFNATIDAIRRELGAGGPLLYRYTGQDAVEGAFVACSFWLAEALARAGRVAEARETMDGMLELSNDVGLFAEEIDPATKEHLGNFPQGLSHLALVNAAAAIADADG